jgi:hypothetical protein
MLFTSARGFIARDSNLLEYIAMIDTVRHTLATDETIAAAVEPAAGSLPFDKKYPALFRFVDSIRLGCAAEGTGTMLLFRDSTKWKLCLNDRPNAKSAFVTHRNLAELLAIADIGIAQKRLEWHQRGYKSKSGNTKLPFSS